MTDATPGPGSTGSAPPKPKRVPTPAQARAQADFAARMKAAWADKKKAGVSPGTSTVASPPPPAAPPAAAPTSAGTPSHGSPPSGPVPGVPRKAWFHAVGLGSLLGGKGKA